MRAQVRTAGECKRILSRPTNGRTDGRDCRHLGHNSDTNGQHSEKQHYALAAPEEGSWMRPVPPTPGGAFLRVIKVTECDTPLPSPLPMRFGRRRFRTMRCTTAAAANGRPGQAEQTQHCRLDHDDTGSISTSAKELPAGDVREQAYTQTTRELKKAANEPRRLAPSARKLKTWRRCVLNYTITIIRRLLASSTLRQDLQNNLAIPKYTKTNQRQVNLVVTRLAGLDEDAS